MRVTLLHPCIGRRAADRGYIRSWQMEPLAPAVLAALTPRDVDVRFYDDRLEAIPFDEPTDLVALSVETYTARRSYQIASAYRARGVPVVMGGFHPTLCPEEAARYADAIVVGEAEILWPELLDDFRHGTMRRVYRAAGRPPLASVTPDRRIFRGKRYVPVSLVEAGRGCTFHCDFCAIQTAFGATQTRRPIDEVIAEIRGLAKRTRLFFFVDDNIAADRNEAKAFYRALAALRVRWVSQASIHAALDEELLALIARSGCEGLLVGIETLDAANLGQMNKPFNAAGGLRKALAGFRRHGIRLYATFVFGYDGDTAATFAEVSAFAREQRFYIAAFNHLTPFPGTPLYRRLESEGRLLHDAWWMSPDYGYNQIPFRPAQLAPEELQRLCYEIRRDFYSLRSIARRMADPVNRASAFMARQFPLINFMIRREVAQRDGLPLGVPDAPVEMLTFEERPATPYRARSAHAV